MQKGLFIAYSESLATKGLSAPGKGLCGPLCASNAIQLAREASGKPLIEMEKREFWLAWVTNQGTVLTV